MSFGRALVVMIPPLASLAQELAPELPTIEYLPPHRSEWSLLCPQAPPSLQQLAELLGREGLFAVDSTGLALQLHRLRASGWFTEAELLADSLAEGFGKRIRLRLRCASAVLPSGQLTEGIGSAGLTVQLAPLWRLGDSAGFALRYRRELDLGWEAAAGATVAVPLLSRASGEIRFDRFRQQFALHIGDAAALPSLARWHAGLLWHYSNGTRWDFRSPAPTAYHRREQLLGAWLRWRTVRRDELLLTLLLARHRGTTAAPYAEAFDNTAWVLLGVASLARRGEQSAAPDRAELPILLLTGAWGAVTLGIGFPTPDGGERLSYLAGELEQSGLLLGGRAFGALRIAAGNAFIARQARYTLLQTAAHGWYRWSPHLLLCAELRQQTLWNWERFAQYRLDVLSDFPVLPFPGPAAENAIQLRTELRSLGTLPLLPALGWRAGIVSYAGSTWAQGVKLRSTRWSRAFGLALGLSPRRHGGAWELSGELLFVPPQRWRGVLSLRLLPDLYAFHRYRLPLPLHPLDWQP
jgi:hypothetical protein